MTRWMHPPELQYLRERERFDPLSEGARYALSRELSLAIWERVCADTTDNAGRRDEDQARQRFHELAARIAARGGRLHPDVGRVTRVDVELDDRWLGMRDLDGLRPSTPGKQTLAQTEARRSRMLGERSPASAAAIAEDAPMVASGLAVGPLGGEHLGASDIGGGPGPPSRMGEHHPVGGHAPASRHGRHLNELFSAGRGRAADCAAPQRDRAERAADLPFRTEMEQRFGERLDDVDVDVNPFLPRGALAATEHGRITFAKAAPSKATVAHEVAHLLQYRRGVPSTAAALGARSDDAEHEAGRAARDILAGRDVQIRQVPTARMHLQEPTDEPADGAEIVVVGHAIEFYRRGDGLEVEVMWYALLRQEGRDHAPLSEGEIPPQFASPRLRATRLIQRLEEHTGLRMVREARDALLQRIAIPLTQRDRYAYTAQLSTDDLRQWFGASAWQDFLDGRTVLAGAGTATDDTQPAPTVTVEEVLQHLAEDRWDVDDLAGQLTDAQMRSLSSTDRVRLIDNISGGTLVLNDDEHTIVRLLATTPPVQALSVRDQLGTRLLQQLDGAIDFDDYRDYHDAVRRLFFDSLTPEEAQEQMANAQVFPWANPGIIHALWNVRFYYEECELHDDGKVHISFWMNLGPIGMRSQTLALDPFKMIAVRFFYPEEYAGAERGQTVYMPAINLRSLHRHQFKGDLQTTVDVGLLFAGGAGVISAGTRMARIVAALDLAVAAAAITINDFRHDIAQLEHGPEFLAAWDVVQTLIAAYGVGRMVMQAPAALSRLRGAFQRFRGTSPRLPPETMRRIESEVDDVFRQADEAEGAASGRPHERSNTGGTGTVDDSGLGAAEGRTPGGSGGTHESAPPTTTPRPPQTIQTADDLINASEGRPGLPNPLGKQYPGHAGDHIPPAGADRTAAMAHAQLRPNKANTTVYYSRRHALQDLRDALTAHADEIAQLQPGQTLNFRFGTPLRPGFNSVRGAAATEVSFDEISVVLERLTSGELHLVQFTPRLSGL